MKIVSSQLVHFLSWSLGWGHAILRYQIRGAGPALPLSSTSASNIPPPHTHRREPLQDITSPSYPSSLSFSFAFLAFFSTRSNIHPCKILPLSRGYETPLYGQSGALEKGGGG